MVTLKTLHEPTGTDPPVRVWRTAVLIAFGSLLAGLDTSLVNLGLDSIRTGLDTSLVTVQWVNSGYLLALAAALPVCGWFSRRWGAGRLWTWSLAAFTLTSLLSALSPNIGTLIGGRILQGAAGGLLIPAGMTILGQVAGKERMGRVIAISSVPSILAPAFGPVLGALLVSTSSWHWLFLINVPIGLAGVLLALRRLPRGERGTAGPLDLLSLALITVGLPLIVQGLSTLSEGGGSTWITLPLGVATLAGFTLRSLRTRDPLMDLRLVRNREFTAASAEVFFAGAALFGGLIVMPLYFQIQLGASLVEAGLLLMAFSLGAAATFPIAGWLNDRVGGGVTTTAGLVLAAATTVAMAFLPAEPNLVLLETLQVLRGIALALAGSPGVSSALAAVGQRQIPDASVQVNILSRVGGALGSALFVALLAGHDTTGSNTGSAAAPAFRATFWWLTAATVAALVAAAWLAMEQRRSASLDTQR